MLSVAIITPHDAELGAPAGLCAAGLARAFAGQGWAVHVVCAMSAMPLPRYETRGLLTIHRLEVRRGSPDQAFSLAACKRIHELCEAGRCDVIECVDAPAGLLASAALARLTGRRLPLVSVMVDPRADDSSRARCARALAHERISTHETPSGDPRHIPFPLVDGLWRPPQTRGPVLVVDEEPDDHDARCIIHAYKQSRSPVDGWSLAIRGHDGRWNITGAPLAGPSGAGCVLIAFGQASPAAALHALRRGSLVIAADHSPLVMNNPDWPLIFQAHHAVSLSGAIDRALKMPVDQQRMLAESWFDRLGGAHEPMAVARAHARLWEEIQNSPLPSSLGAWRLLEQHPHPLSAGAGT